MAKLFIGIALALMLATAALGFLAKGNIDKLQSSIKGSKNELAAEQSKTRSAQADLKKFVEERDAAATKAEEVTKILDAKNAEVAAAKEQADLARAAVDAKTAEIARLNEELKTKNKPGDTPMVEDPRIAELTAQVQKAQAELAEAKQVSESIANRAKENETKLAALEQKEKRRATQLGAAGLQARILAVNSGWNFVVLSVGDKQGVTVNAPLLVLRGNEPVARLRITSVEPSTSIADVIPGSVRKGVTVQPGDTVIFEGRSSATQVKPSEPVPAPDLPKP